MSVLNNQAHLSGSSGIMSLLSDIGLIGALFESGVSENKNFNNLTH